MKMILLNNELFDDIREKILHYGALKYQIHVRTKRVHV